MRAFIIGLLFAISSLANASPPSTPTGLAAVTRSASTAGLSWNAASGVGITYNIYQDGLLLGNNQSTSAIVSGLITGTNYGFGVQAKNLNDETSSISAYVTITAGGIPIGDKQFWCMNCSTPGGAAISVSVTVGGSSISSSNPMPITTNGQPLPVTVVASGAYSNTTNAFYTIYPVPSNFDVGTSFVPASFTTMSSSSIVWAGDATFTASLGYLSTTACLYSRTFYSNITISAVHFVLLNSTTIPTNVSVVAKSWTILAQPNTSTTGVITSKDFEMAGSYVLAWLDVASAQPANGSLGRFGVKETNCGYMNQAVYSDASWLMMKLKSWAKDSFFAALEKFVNLTDVVLMPSEAHASIIWSPSPFQSITYTGTTTTTSTTSEQDLVVYTASGNEAFRSIWLDLTALATTVTCTFKVYLRQNGGSYRLISAPGLLTGSTVWTLATDADGYTIQFNLGLSPGDTVRITSTLSVGEARAIPYEVAIMR